MNIEKDKYVFISYSSRDDVQVKRLLELLEEMHISWWKAPEMIPAGSSYAREIVRAIEHCTLFLLLFSQNAQDSIWVEKEVDCAMSFQKETLPFNVDGTVLNAGFKFYLNNVQMIFDTPGSSKGEDELKEYLRGLFPEEEEPVYLELEDILNEPVTAPVHSGQVRKTISVQPVTRQVKKTTEPVAVVPAGQAAVHMTASAVKTKADPKLAVPTKNTAAHKHTAQINRAVSSGSVQVPGKSSGTKQTMPVRPTGNTKHTAPEVGTASEPEKKQKKRRMIARDLNSPNRIPVFCEYCEGSVIRKHDGIFICEKCGQVNYDDFQTIRRYILENGPASTFELEAKLGIPRRIINYWRDEQGNSLR